MVDHKCRKCTSDFGEFGFKGLNLISQLFILVCKKMDIVQMGTRFDFGSIGENYIHEGVLYALGRNYEDKIHIFTYIANKFTINNIETIKIICENIIYEENDQSGIIINYITSRLYRPSNEIIKLLLPHVCVQNLIKFLYYKDFSHNFERSDNNYKFLLNLINDNEYIYPSRVIPELLQILITTQHIYPTDTFNLVKLTCKYGDSNNIISQLLNIIDGNSTYTNETFIKELLQTIQNTNEINIKLNLIRFINTNFQLSEFTQTMVEIANQVVAYDGEKYKTAIKLISLKHLDVDLKLLLLPICYEYCTISLDFLNNSAKLNEISIEMAINFNSDSYEHIYCSHLSNTQLFKYIIMATKNNKNNIRKKLILSINTYGTELYSRINDMSEIFKEVDEIYSQTQHMLPIHYIYDDNVYMCDDSEVICEYKLKVNSKPELNIDIDRILEINYITSLLENNPDDYCKIFDRIILEVRRLHNKGAYNRGYNYGKYGANSVMEFMVNHVQFNQMTLPIDIINILQLFVNFQTICDIVIANHNLFKRFINIDL